MFIGSIGLKIVSVLCQTSFLFSPTPPFLFAYLSIPVTAEVYSDITSGLWCSLVRAHLPQSHVLWGFSACKRFSVIRIYQIKSYIP